MAEEPQRENPSLPQGITLSEFGSRVMQWGTGDAAAIARTRTVTFDWLVTHGVTLAMVEQWLRFYEQVYDENPRNPSAQGRQVLMRYCVGLFRERE